VTVRLQADPADIAPGTDAQFTLTLTNSGAGHYLPTGDPDRYFTVEFQILDHQDKILKEQTHTIGRWVLWQPVIWEVYGNRLQPLESREYAFHYRLPASAEKTNGLQFRAVIRYHILTEKTHEMLKRRYSLTADDPYQFTIFEHEAPLSGAFTDVLQQGWKHDIPEEYLMNERACVDRAPTTGTPLARLFDPGFSH
jgi:hypothetical protein